MSFAELENEYGRKSDEELMRLADSINDLTDEAQSALSRELQKRQIVTGKAADYQQDGSEQLPEQTYVECKPIGSIMRRDAAAWQFLWFALHLLCLYAGIVLALPRIAYWLREVVVPLLRTGDTSSRYDFLFSHLFAFSISLGFLGGLINARFRHKAAMYIWLVPASVLAYKLVSFPTAAASASVLVTHHSALPWFEYFGGRFRVQEFHDWREFWSTTVTNPDYMRGMRQVMYTAPFYAGCAYSLAALLSRWKRIDESLKHRILNWGERRFSRAAADSE